jgi:hypothetical protein
VNVQASVLLLGTVVRLEGTSVDAVAYVKASAEIREDLVDAMKGAVARLDKIQTLMGAEEPCLEQAALRRALRKAGVFV